MTWRRDLGAGAQIYADRCLGSMHRPIIGAGWITWRRFWLDLSWGDPGSDAVWCVGVEIVLPCRLARRLYGPQEWGE